MKEFLIFFVVLFLFEILKQNPPVIFLNYSSDRLYKKILGFLKKNLDKYETQLKEKDESSISSKKQIKEFISNTEKEIKNLKELRDVVYQLIGKYQDKSKKYNHIVKIWVEYLQIYEELEDANSHDEVGVLDIIGWDNMRIKQLKMDANEKALKELLKYGEWTN